jgi:hypothetical protein
MAVYSGAPCGAAAPSGNAAAATATSTSSSMLVFGNRIKLSPTATGKAQQCNVPVTSSRRTRSAASCRRTPALTSRQASTCWS